MFNYYYNIINHIKQIKKIVIMIKNINKDIYDLI